MRLGQKAVGISSPLQHAGDTTARVLACAPPSPHTRPKGLRHAACRSRTSPACSAPVPAAAQRPCLRLLSARGAPRNNEVMDQDGQRAPDSPDEAEDAQAPRKAWTLRNVQRDSFVVAVHDTVEDEVAPPPGRAMWPLPLTPRSSATVCPPRSHREKGRQGERDTAQDFTWTSS